MPNNGVIHTRAVNGEYSPDDRARLAELAWEEHRAREAVAEYDRRQAAR